MSSDWKRIRLADCCEINPESITQSWPYKEFSYIDISSVGEGESIAAFERIDRSSAPSRAQRLVTSGDTLLSLVRPTRRSMLFLKCPEPDTVVSTGFAVLRANPNLVHPRFLYYLVFDRQFTRYLESREKGAAYPAVTVADIADAEVDLPPLRVQYEVIRSLSALDDKIELNRRMNATLEAMAKALFKSWFIDFDPVRAKLDGRQPQNLDPTTAALFPDSFQDSELGQIPIGWRVVELRQIADVVDCLHSKKPERSTNGRLLLQLNNIRNDGLVDLTDSYLIDEMDYQKWISRMEAVAGDCVITNVGRVGAVGQIPEGVKAALGRNITGIRCKEEFPFPTFLVECLVSDSMREEILRKTDTGTILDALNVRSIPTLRLVCPNWTIGLRFEEVTRPIRRRMEQNVASSRSLAILRDTLLPSLVSGDLKTHTGGS